MMAVRPSPFLRRAVTVPRSTEITWAVEETNAQSGFSLWSERSGSIKLYARLHDSRGLMRLRLNRAASSIGLPAECSIGSPVGDLRNSRSCKLPCDAFLR